MNDSALNSTDSEKEVSTIHDSDMARGTVGACLLAQREALGWTVEHVASQLNLAPRQIHALERDDYAALPGIASVRGFIRAYAKLLKVDPVPLIALIPAENIQAVESLQTRPSLETPFAHGASLPSLSSTASASKTTLVLIALAVLAAMVFAGFQLGWVSSASLPFSVPVLSDTSSREAPTTAGHNEAAQPALQPAGVIDNPAATAPDEPAGVPIGDAASNGIATNPAPVATAPENAAAGNMLVLTVHEDSWVEARRVGNTGEGAQRTGSTILISRLVKSGTTETIDVSEPIALTIGNASGVDATLRGAPFDLKAAAKNNIARVNVK